MSRALFNIIAVVAFLGCAVMFAADNDQAAPKFQTGNFNQVQIRTTDTAGVHVPHVILDSGAVTSSSSRSTTIATAQATLSTTASQISALNSARRGIIVRNVDAAISIYVGATGVTSSTGFLVKAGETVSVTTTAAIFAVAASGTPVVNILTEND